MAFDLFGIVSAVQNFFGSIGTLIGAIRKPIDHVLGIWDKAKTLTDSVKGEIDGWKNFKQDIRFKQRVVNLETAVTKTRDLIEGIPASWHAIVDIVKQVKSSLTQVNPQAAATELESEFATGLEESGIKGLLSRFPRLLKGLEKFGVVLGAIAGALEEVATVFDDLQTIVDELKRLRLEVEKLDTIFLSQSNKRKTLKLADGSTIRVRVGHLHS